MSANQYRHGHTAWHTELGGGHRRLSTEFGAQVSDLLAESVEIRKQGGRRCLLSVSDSFGDRRCSQSSSFHQHRKQQVLGKSWRNQEPHDHYHRDDQAGADRQLNQHVLHGSLLRRVLTRGSGQPEPNLLPPTRRIWSSGSVGESSHPSAGKAMDERSKARWARRVTDCRRVESISRSWPHPSGNYRAVGFLITSRGWQRGSSVLIGPTGNWQ